MIPVWGYPDVNWNDRSIGAGFRATAARPRKISTGSVRVLGRRERVIASTDYGLGGRVHPEIAWAKLEALAQGAARASRQLWR